MKKLVYIITALTLTAPAHSSAAEQNNDKLKQKENTYRPSLGKLIAFAAPAIATYCCVSDMQDQALQFATDPVTVKVVSTKFLFGFIPYQSKSARKAYKQGIQAFARNITSNSLIISALAGTFCVGVYDVSLGILGTSWHIAKSAVGA